MDIKLNITNKTTEIFGIYVNNIKDPYRERFIKLYDWKFPIHIGMPCGFGIHYARKKDIPLVDIKCSCGNSGHWLIKWER